MSRFLENFRILFNWYLRTRTFKNRLKFRIYITAGIYGIVFEYIYLVKTYDLNIELLAISTDSIWNLCGF
jgi:hypothetical protein